MKFTLKLFLVVCLFSSVAFADGDMGAGGYGGDGDMGAGGRTCTENDDCRGSSITNQKEAENSVLSFIQDYLASIFG